MGKTKMKLRDVIEAHKWSKKDGRNYEKERKYNDTPKARAYRAKLNKYNRDKGTYANDDGKDASHKNGKITGFEKESKNRGRAEKSRLKGSKRARTFKQLRAEQKKRNKKKCV